MDARARILVVFAGLLALAAAATLGYWLGDRPGGKTSVDRIEAVIDADGDADAIVLRGGAPPDFLGTGLDVAGADGADCIVPSVRGQRVELGVVHVRPGPDGAGRDIVVWVKCFGEPERIDAPALLLVPPDLRREIVHDFPGRGARVRFTRNRYLGSGSDLLDVPDVRRGSEGTVLGVSGELGQFIVVAWQEGPTLPMLSNDFEVVARPQRK